MRKNSNFIVNFIIVVVIVIVGCVSFYNDEMGYDSFSKPVNGLQQENVVSFMFSVTTGGEYLHGIMKVFDENEAKATFFINGKWAENNVDLVKLLRNRGYEIANGGYLNRNLSKISTSEVKGEITTAENLLYNITGVKTKLFAPPGGIISENVLRACDELGYTVIGYSTDSMNTVLNDEDEIVDNLTSNLKGGDIIKFHLNENTEYVLRKTIEFCQKKGFEIKLLSECL